MSVLSQFFGGSGITRKRQQVFTSSGTFVPSERLLALGGWVEVLCVGGGGGGYASSSMEYGGGGGAVVRRVVQVSGNVSVTVGSGGSAGSDGNPSGSGGTSSFGSLVSAPGGGGSEASYASGNGFASAFVYMPNRSQTLGAGGGAGGPAITLFTSENGPGSYIKYGPIPGPGIDGYGCGGVSGQVAQPNTGCGGSPNGAGGSGIVIVEWFE